MILIRKDKQVTHLTFVFFPPECHSVYVNVFVTINMIDLHLCYFAAILTVKYTRYFTRPQKEHSACLNNYNSPL